MHFPWPYPYAPQPPPLTMPTPQPFPHQPTPCHSVPMLSPAIPSIRPPHIRHRHCNTHQCPPFQCPTVFPRRPHRNPHHNLLQHTYQHLSSATSTLSCCCSPHSCRPTTCYSHMGSAPGGLANTAILSVPTSPSFQLLLRRSGPLLQTPTSPPSHHPLLQTPTPSKQSPSQQSPPPQQPTAPSSTPTTTDSTASQPPPQQPDTTSKTDASAGVASSAPQQPRHRRRRYRHHGHRRRHTHRHRGRSDHHHARRSQHSKTTPAHSRGHSTSYSYSTTRSRSPPPRSERPAITLRSNSELATQDVQEPYPKRRARNAWKEPPNFTKKPAQEQLETWLNYHAHQFDTPNSPQSTYVARLLINSGLSYADVCDFQQFTHIKWNNDTNRYDLYHFNHITIHTLPAKAYQRFPPQPTRATNTSLVVAHILGGHTGPAGNITQILQQGRLLSSTLHFQHNTGFFAQGFRAAHSSPHDHIENARIMNLSKNTHSILVTLLAWGAGKKVTQGGEEQAAKLLQQQQQQQHGAVFHQNGGCWAIEPKNAIVRSIAWSSDATPPALRIYLHLHTTSAPNPLSPPHPFHCATFHGFARFRFPFTHFLLSDW